MDNEKRKIIVSEIEHWRRSRLLPEQYCDFLLNLYLDEHKEKQKSVMGINQSTIRNSNWKSWFTVFGIIGLISFIVLHFTSFRVEMQTGISLAAVAVFYLLGAAKREKQPLVSYLCFGIGSVLMLVMGLFIFDSQGVTGLPVVLFVGACSLVWMLTGIMAGMAAFHFGGWLVLFLIYAWVLRQNIRDLDWIGLQLSWVPISIVLAWLGWLFHHVNKKTCAVLLAAGVIAWFGAEIYGMTTATGVASALLQVSLFGKIVAAGAILFAMRKKWIEWVA